MRGCWPAIIDQDTWDTVQSILGRLRRGGSGGAPKRTYAFQGLLRCAACGMRMCAHTMPSGAYRCRSTGASIGCGQGVREDRVLPWGRAVMAWLEGAADRAAVREAVEAELRDEPISGRPADALDQIDGTLERIGQRYEWGEFAEATYRAKRTHYLALRAEVEPTVASRGAQGITLTGLVDAWDSNDPLTRRQLLWTLFDSLDVLRGAVVAGQPRQEVEAEVAAYLSGWVGPDGLPLRLRFAEASDVETSVGAEPGSS